MQLEIVDGYEAFFRMNEREFLEFRDVMEAANRQCELVEVSSRSHCVTGSLEAFLASGIYVKISEYTVRVVGDWRGALQDYASSAFLEGIIDGQEAETLVQLAS